MIYPDSVQYVRTQIEEKHARALEFPFLATQGESTANSGLVETKQREYTPHLARRGNYSILAHYSSIWVFPVAMTGLSHPEHIHHRGGCHTYLSLSPDFEKIPGDVPVDLNVNARSSRYQFRNIRVLPENHMAPQ